MVELKVLTEQEHKQHLLGDTLLGWCNVVAFLDNPVAETVAALHSADLSLAADGLPKLCAASGVEVLGETEREKEKPRGVSKCMLSAGSHQWETMRREGGWVSGLVHQGIVDQRAGCGMMEVTHPIG